MPLEELPFRSRSHFAHTLHRLVRQPATLAALAILIAIFTAGGFAHELAPQGWNAIDLSTQWANHAPTLSGWHLLGTDNIGRDILVRTLYGIHDTEVSALFGALLATLLGLAVGGLAGLHGGLLDVFLMRIADLVTAFPAMVLMLAAFVFLTPVTTTTATLIFAGYMWTFVARIVRARFTTLRAEEFVQAARALGATDTRIFIRHLLPNAAGAMLVSATSLVGQIVLLEATVEFFGFGVASQVHPTLGNLIADATSSGIGAYNFLGLGWWAWAGPALALVLILVCTNIAGDGLDTALNPRTARR
jgi:ABC-type dipeptide/oligopeptide/nickel transport system permease subunit